MLSRVADSLYWMGRYTERSENVARLVDVNLQLMLDLPQGEAQRFKKDWGTILSCLDLKRDFLKNHTSSDSKTVTKFLVIEDQPHSLLNQIKLARENARAVREEISTEMWEQVNRTYLWSVSRAAHQLFLSNPYDFFHRIKQESHLFQGITDATLPHREAWHFIQLGKYIERTDKTSCFLDNRLFQSADALLALVTVLKSCSAQQAYQKRHQMKLQLQPVVEFLCHDPSFPRSITYCLNQLRNLLQTIAKEHHTNFKTLSPAKVLHTLLKEIQTIHFKEISPVKLHSVLRKLQINLNQLDEAIFKTYLCYNTSVVKNVTRQ